MKVTNDPHNGELFGAFFFGTAREDPPVTFSDKSVVTVCIGVHLTS